MTSAVEPASSLFGGYSYAIPTSPAPVHLQSMHVSPHHHVVSASPSSYAYSTPRSRSTRSEGGGGGGGGGPDNPPCNTLFVGNLGEHVSESELQSVFGPRPGYRQVKVLRQPHSTVCFVEFADVESATAAHSEVQGAILTSSERGPLRVQFSKNPFGRKKDGSFHPGSAAAGGGTPENGGAHNGAENSAPGEGGAP